MKSPNPTATTALRPTSAIGPIRAISEGVVGDWSCNGNPNDIYSICKNENVSHLTDKGTWKVSNGTLELRWDNGYLTVFEIREIGDQLIGKSYPPERPDSPDKMVFRRVGELPVRKPATVAPATLPAKLEITDSTGRKIKVTILSKTAEAIRIRRDGDGREFVIPIEKLSGDDKKFLENLGKPGEIDVSTFQIEFNGERIEVTRVGSGPVGVLCFGSASNLIKRVIPDEKEKFRGLLPMRTKEEREEIAATLAMAEDILESPEYQTKEFHGPSYSKTMHGILHCRLGHYKLAIQRFDEALRIADVSGSDTLDWERTMDAIHRPLALHGLGRVDEAKRMFLANPGNVRLWKDDQEPLRGGKGVDGMDIAVFLSYKDAARIFGVAILEPGRDQHTK